ILPPNGIIDAGETVTVALALRNSGTANTVNLNAILLETNGVTLPDGSISSASYGTLIRGGPAVPNTFIFTAAESSPTAQILATLQLSDDTGFTTNVVFAFSISGNAPALSIPDHGPASLYPSTVYISGMTGSVQTVSVTLHGLSH